MSGSGKWFSIIHVIIPDCLKTAFPRPPKNIGMKPLEYMGPGHSLYNSGWEDQSCHIIICQCNIHSPPPFHFLYGNLVKEIYSRVLDPYPDNRQEDLGSGGCKWGFVVGVSALEKRFYVDNIRSVLFDDGRVSRIRIEPPKSLLQKQMKSQHRHVSVMRRLKAKQAACIGWREADMLNVAKRWVWWRNKCVWIIVRSGFEKLNSDSPSYSLVFFDVDDLLARWGNRQQVIILMHDLSQRLRMAGPGTGIHQNFEFLYLKVVVVTAYPCSDTTHKAVLEALRDCDFVPDVHCIQQLTISWKRNAFVNGEHPLISWTCPLSRWVRRGWCWTFTREKNTHWRWMSDACFEMFGFQKYATSGTGMGLSEWKNFDEC